MRLITPSRVIALSFTNKTNETNLIKDSIIEAAQLDHIQPVLGVDLWDLIESEWDTNGDSSGLSADNLVLFNKLEIPLAFFVKHELIPDMSINTTGAGLQVITTEQSSPATDKQRGDLQDVALKHANTLLDEIIRWIELPANLPNYPKYNSANNAGGTITENGGIIF